MANTWKKIIGTLSSTFQLGLGGARVKNVAGVVQIRNPTDTGFAGVASNAVDVQDINGNRVRLQSPDIAADYAITLPTTAGSPAQVLTTDGAGVTSWTTVAGGADKPVYDTTNLAFGDTSPKAMFTLPANAIVNQVILVIDTPFNGAPSLSVGITGTVSKYAGATDLDLTQAATTVFEIEPGITSSGSAENIIASYAAGGATVGTARIIVAYVIPS
jgi:hypothetical protein